MAGGAGFISNLVLLNEHGYFDNSAETKPLLHLWSLGIEEQFYLVWPLLLAFVWSRRWPFVAIIATLGLASIAVNMRLSGSDPTAAFYLPVSRWWELMLGSGLACVALYRQPLIASHKNLQSIIGAALLAAALVFLDKDHLFPRWWAWAALPTVGAVFLIAAGPGAWINRTILANPALVQVGLISYPLYLWHWPLLSFARIVESRKPSIALRLSLVALAFVLAWVTYKLIEQPVRAGKRRTTAALGLAAAMLVVGSLGYFTAANGGFSSRLAMANYSWNPSVTGQFAGTNWRYQTNTACLNRYPFADAASYDWWFCMVSTDHSPTVAVLGSSYANALYPGLASQPALSAQTVLSIGTCHPVTVDPSTADDDDPDDPCSGRRALRQQHFIDDLVASTPTIKFIILDGLYEDPDADYIARLQSRIRAFEHTGARVIVFEPHLRMEVDIRGCFNRPLRPASLSCDFDTARRDEERRSFQPLIDALSISNPSVLFFDPNGLFCQGARCSLVRDGLPLYRDEYQHISEYGSRLLSDLFVAWSREHVPDLVSSAAINRGR